MRDKYQSGERLIFKYRQTRESIDDELATSLLAEEGRSAATLCCIVPGNVAPGPRDWGHENRDAERCRAANLHPDTFAIGSAGQPAQQTKFLMNQVLIGTTAGWKVLSILPTPVPAP